MSSSSSSNNSYSPSISPSTSPSSSPSISSNTLMRDFEIEMLKEKIKFMQSQINEKDTQLEYYRGLAQTLQDLLNMSHRSNQFSTVTSSSAGEQEENNSKHFTPIRGKKSVSFHEDVKVHYIQDSLSSSL